MTVKKRRRRAAASDEETTSTRKKKATTKKKATRKKASSKKAADQVKWPKFRNIEYEPYSEKQNIGNLAKQLIMMGKGTDDIIDKVLSVKPDSKISPSHVSYYRQALTKEGYDLPEDE